MNTDDVVNFDRCPRLGIWANKWQQTIPVHLALHLSLTAGLTASTNPGREAMHTFTQLASNPGLDVQIQNVYESAIHHAFLVENLANYLRGTDGPWTLHEPVKVGQHLFSPQAFLMPDGRLRRVVLAGYWDANRKKQESRSWRTVADISATGRPMLINVLIIGANREGLRPTPWTRGFKHPTNSTIRTCRLGDKDFASSWRKLYRESADIDSMRWLKMMQDDNAFDKLVTSFTVDSGARQGELESVLDSISLAPDNPPMRRAGCHEPSLCGFARICHAPKETTPGLELWKTKAK